MGILPILAALEALRRLFGLCLRRQSTLGVNMETAKEVGFRAFTSFNTTTTNPIITGQ